MSPILNIIEGIEEAIEVIVVDMMEETLKFKEEDIEEEVDITTNVDVVVGVKVLVRIQTSLENQSTLTLSKILTLIFINQKKEKKNRNLIQAILMQSSLIPK
jgi:hypothetical protein